MAGGGKVRITGQDFSNIAEVVNGRLLVSSTGGGGGGGDVNITEYGGVAVGPANPIDIAGAVTQATHASLNAQVRVQDNDGADMMGVYVSGDAATATPSAPTLMMRYEAIPDLEFPGQGLDTFYHLRCDAGGRLAVGIDDVIQTIGVVTQPTAALLNATVVQPTAASLNATVVQATAASLNATAAQPTHNLLNVTTRIQDGDGANLADVVGTGEVAPSPVSEGGPYGQVPMAWATATGSATQETWSPLQMNKFGQLLVEGDVEATVISVIPGTGATQLGKAEDARHSDGDVGVMALAVRNDTLASLANATGDYIPFTTDALGRLWVRNSTFDTIALSGSTRGRPISIVATATLGTTLHVATTTAGELDRVFIDLTNTSAVDILVTIEFGAAGVGNEIDITVPANTTVPAIEGMVLGGAATDTITAYAGTASVVNAVGRVERIPA